MTIATPVRTADKVTVIAAFIIAPTTPFKTPAIASRIACVKASLIITKPAVRNAQSIRTRISPGINADSQALSSATHAARHGIGIILQPAIF